MKIFLTSLTRGDPRVEYMGSVLKVYNDPRINYIDIRPTLYLHHGRTEAANEFLNRGKEDWLLFVDDDMCFTTQAVDTLIAFCESSDDIKIAGGIYWSPRAGTYDPTNEVFPVVYMMSPGEREGAYTDDMLHRPYPRKWVADQISPFKVDAIGTGFLMVHRDVFLDLASRPDLFPPPLRFFAMDTINGVATGEDLTFCHRAATLGYDVWAVPFPDANDLVHIKTVRIRRPSVG